MMERGSKIEVVTVNTETPTDNVCPLAAANRSFLEILCHQFMMRRHQGVI